MLKIFLFRSFNQESNPSILHDHEDRALLLSWPDHEGNTSF